MHPEFHVPGLGVLQWSNVLLAAGVVAHAVLAYRWLRRDDIGARRAVRGLIVFWLAAFAGGRTHHLLASSSGGLTWRTVLSPSFHTPGMLLGALAAIGFAIPRLGIPAGRFFDGVAGPAGIAFGIARIGCFLNGCCLGTYCPYPWGVVFPKESLVYLMQVNEGLIPLGAEQVAPVHPLQLYFVAAGFAIASFLYWWRPRRRFDGEVGLFFLALFSVSSMVLELFRAEEPGRAHLWGHPQLLVVMTLVAIAAVTVVGIIEWLASRRLTASRTR